MMHRFSFTRRLLPSLLLLSMISLPALAQLQWEQIDGGLAVGRTIADLVVDSTGHIFALNQDGVLYRWESDSSRWSAIWSDVTTYNPFHIIERSLVAGSAGLFATIEFEVAIPQGPDVLKGTGYTPMHSIDGGKKWKSLINGIPSAISTNGNGMTVVAVAHTNYNFIANGIYGGTVLLSTDNGATWTSSSDDAQLPALRAIAITPSGTIFTGGMDESDAPERSGFFRSVDSGLSWQPVGDTTWNDRNYHIAVKRLAASPDGTIFAAFNYHWPDGPSVYRSTDNGDSWQGIVNAVDVERFVVADTGIVLLEYNQDWQLRRSRRSTDNCDTWSDIPNDIHNLLIAPDGDLYGLGSGYIWHSGDVGATWEKVSEALPVAATSFTITPARYIYAGTQSSGVYRTTRSLSVAASDREAASELALGENVPTPCTGLTTIPISLPHDSQVKLTVHDLLGRTIATLVDVWMPAGQSEVRFDASRCASGVYLIVLSAGGERVSRRVVVE